MNKTNSIEPAFDMFRLSKSKETVDLCSNTIRAFSKEGLRIYRVGKSAFVSRSELRDFIISRGATMAQRVEAA